MCSGCCGCIRDFYSGIIRGRLFYKICLDKMDVRVKIVRCPFQVFVFMNATCTNIYHFRVRHPRCVEYKPKRNIIYIFILRFRGFQFYLGQDYNRYWVLAGGSCYKIHT